MYSTARVVPLGEFARKRWLDGDGSGGRLRLSWFLDRGADVIVGCGTEFLGPEARWKSRQHRHFHGGLGGEVSALFKSMEGPIMASRIEGVDSDNSEHGAWGQVIY